MAKDKQNTVDQFTPVDLKRLEDKGDKAVEKVINRSLFSKMFSPFKMSGLSKEAKRKRIAALIMTISAIILLLAFLISWLFNAVGDLVISVDDGAARKGIVISDSSDGTSSDPKAELTAEVVQEVTNTTYEWLPTNLNDEADGSHNGKNHLAYTFYLKNNGKETLELDSTLRILDVKNNADEALRVMIYKNGEPTIYAKKNADGSNLEEIVNFEFVDDKTVLNDTTNEIKPDDVIKYTIVTWIEGNDPECTNELLGGSVKMQWFFNVHGDEL